MLNSKTRSKLNAMAQKIQPVFQIGKNGVTDTVIKELSDVLEARELIKITVLNNSELKAKDVMSELCEKLNAEPVSVIGFKIVLYKKSNKKGINHIL